MNRLMWNDGHIGAEDRVRDGSESPHQHWLKGLKSTARPRFRRQINKQFIFE